jgi:hypothetical protein
VRPPSPGRHGKSVPRARRRRNVRR